MSKAQIDRLGDRLRKEHFTDADLRLLDEYRDSFAQAYDVVAGSIRRKLGLEPTGRPAKSTTSITEKLRRESIRLTQIQDIAGCRLVVYGIPDQESLLASLVELFPDSTVVDRRRNPSHGYRAVHIIAKVEGKAVEIQVRTALQHGWAELSEKLSDVIHPAIKYGGGDESIRNFLTRASKLVAEYEEDLEPKVMVHRQHLQKMLSERSSRVNRDEWQEIIELQAKVESEQIALRQNVLDMLRQAGNKWKP